MSLDLISVQSADFHWAHDGAYYEMQRKQLLRTHGIDVEDGSAGTIRRRDMMQDFDVEERENKTVFTIREKNKRKLAYSVVGTVSS
jgi:protein-serine/threonine kinase